MKVLKQYQETIGKAKYLVKIVYLDKIYTDADFIQLDYFESFNARGTFIGSERSGGKTTKYLKTQMMKAVEKDEKFIYTVHTKDTVVNLSANNGETFFSGVYQAIQEDNSESKRGQKRLSYFKGKKIDIVNGNNKEVKDDDEDINKSNIRRGVVSLNNKQIGRIVSINDYSALKSNSFDKSYKTMIVDEAVKEKRDIRDLDNDRKVTNLINTIARKRDDFKVIFLYNTVTRNDAILRAFHMDDIQKGTMKMYYNLDTKRYDFIGAIIDPIQYPKMLNKTALSTAGTFDNFTNNMDENNADFADDINSDLLIPKINRQRSRTVFHIKGLGDSYFRIMQCEDKITWYILLEDAKDYKNGYCCFPEYNDYNTTYSVDIKNACISMLNANRIRFETLQAYYLFKEMLKLK